MNEYKPSRPCVFGCPGLCTVKCRAAGTCTWSINMVPRAAPNLSRRWWGLVLALGTGVWVAAAFGVLVATVLRGWWCR